MNFIVLREAEAGDRKHALRTVFKPHAHHPIAVRMRPYGNRYSVTPEFVRIRMNIWPDHNDSVRGDADASAFVVVSPRSDAVSVYQMPGPVDPDVGHRQLLHVWGDCGF
jgi:hypothetical protein